MNRMSWYWQYPSMIVIPNYVHIIYCFFIKVQFSSVLNILKQDFKCLNKNTSWHYYHAHFSNEHPVRVLKCPLKMKVPFCYISFTRKSAIHNAGNCIHCTLHTASSTSWLRNSAAIYMAPAARWGLQSSNFRARKASKGWSISTMIKGHYVPAGRQV